MRKARRVSRHIDKGFEAPPVGWSVASYDPNALLDAFPSLRMRNGFQMAGYQFYDGANASGFVFAIPEDQCLPAPHEGFGLELSANGIATLSSKDEPTPEWIRPDIGSFLEGDGSPLSFFQAAIFIRELQEMGSFWHGCSWSTHEVITSATQIAKQKWEWKETQPGDWRPVVCQISAGLWQVVFYSHTGLGREQIVIHKDTFTEGYQFDPDEEVIALGEGGYVF